MKFFQLLFVTLLTNVFTAAAQANNGDDDCATQQEHCVAKCKAEGKGLPKIAVIIRTGQDRKPLPAPVKRKQDRDV
ncbi:hypothetical protein PgNI_06626 [Pyricularia grisea]|uniref:Uncharacterized protein n=1 Tax=Pyricularia grisea TaxID=148305 RepID=A0A6P8B646_PYRGI|nr:hypothetical protein PgNI_06626 [Pyricularia grisea]TLD10821.1 hypothetical protein PgNI_06626 [Pyricularia grisea]